MSDRPGDLTRTLLWGSADIPGTASLFGESACPWQGVRDEASLVWWMPALMGEVSTDQTGLNRREFTVLREWGDTANPQITVANFVIRELEPDSLDELMPQLYRQIEAVVARPGCLGNTLAAQVDAPGNLLGITFWPDVAAFDNYMRWASNHPWGDIITPVTRSVPLRLLTRRA